MKKILIIEDNKDILDNISEILGMSHYKVFGASGGREGMAQALANKPDLILCDIMMPDLDGYGVLHMVQKNPELQDTPFIFLSALAERSDIRKGMSLGADDYIPKPFDPTDLLNTVENRLKRADQIKEKMSIGLKGVDELVGMVGGEQVLKNFVEGRHVDRYKKRERIYAEGNHPVRLYYVQSGRVKIFKTNEDGKELIVKIANANDFFGYTALLESGVYKENADALEESLIAAIPKAEFEDLMYSNSFVTRRFIKLLASDVSEKEEQLLHIAYNSLRRKVADALLSVHQKYMNTEKFCISMSRENLAAVAGTATESLIRTLTEFRAENLIDIKDGKIAILSQERLNKLLN
jgi:DNA-binding response OmpR family regulator